MAKVATRLYIGKKVSWNNTRAIRKLSTTVEEPEEPGVDTGNYLAFTSANDFTLGVIDNTKYWKGTLEYSTNATTWAVWDGTVALSSSAGKLYLRGTGNTFITGSSVSTSSGKGYWVFNGISPISSSGNIENLLDYNTVANNGHPEMAVYCYAFMFFGNLRLESAPELPATKLSDYCYRGMFQGCGLTSLPELPATTLATYCYQSMFQNCRYIMVPVSLPATTLASGCYYSMFEGCTSLQTVPPLRFTTVATYCCYRMFYGCTSLTTLPIMYATTLLAFCYAYMFGACTAIRLSTAGSSEYPNLYKIPYSGTGTVSNNSLYYMFANTGGTFKGTPEINTTYYTRNSLV